jgi:K+-transporting ATPase ATPase C chain
MKSFLISLKIFLVFTILTGIIYPLLITGTGQLMFPEKANGSMIIRDNKPVGSKLIGQQFDSVIYFSSRPSSISYNPMPSGGSNYSSTNKKLISLVNERKLQFITFNDLDSTVNVPSGMLFASASGLDPHISPGAAYLQVERIARNRNFSNDQKLKLLTLIRKRTEVPQLLLLGEERINVLLLNLDLDKIQ